MEEIDFKNERFWLMKGDCVERMKEIPSCSIDMIFADLPYGTTACKWDTVIPLDPMWEQICRVIKPDRAIVMTASQPYTTTLIASNMNGYCYNWVWYKRFAANYVQAKRQPLKDHEDVCVFSATGKMPIYIPQMIERKKPIKKGKNVVEFGAVPLKGSCKNKNKVYDKKYPTSTSLSFNVRDSARGLHPTQKPMDLLEYLIKTYTNENETVLDFVFGSCTTGLAAKNLNRKFIGIEKENEYFAMGKRRLDL